MRLLFLTDHRFHRSFDSVYLLSQWLNETPDFSVQVASLGAPENRHCLTQERIESVSAIRPSSDCVFENRNACFSANAELVSVCHFDAVCLRVLPISEKILNVVTNSFDPEKLVNSATGIILTEQKRFLLEFPELCPPMRMCNGVSDTLRFIERFPVVLKPMYGYGGKSNILVNEQQCFDGQKAFLRDDLTDVLLAKFGEGGPYLAMRFLPNYFQGDKRILVVNGEVVGASLRMPQRGNWLCNVSSGGSVNRTKLDTHEYHAVEILTARLAKEGISMFGIDTLVGDDGERLVTEINTCCPGGFYSINTVLGDAQIKSKTVTAFINLLT